MSTSFLVAECPTHGLHGCREHCFECGGPVKQVKVVRYCDYEKARAQGAEEERERLAQDEKFIERLAFEFEGIARYALPGTDEQVLSNTRAAFTNALTALDTPAPSEPEEARKVDGPVSGSSISADSCPEPEPAKCICAPIDIGDGVQEHSPRCPVSRSGRVAPSQLEEGK